MHTTPTRSGAGAKVVALASLAILALVALAAPAAAHVHASGELVDGGATRVILSFSHGCEGEPTTTLRVRYPDGGAAVTPLETEGWTSTVSGQEIIWTGGSVPDGEEAEFAFTAVLTQSPGEEVLVPTIQECPNGTNEWIEPPTDDDSEASSPAPSFTVPEGTGQPGDGATEPAGDDHGDDGTADDEEEQVTAISVPEDELESDGDPSDEETAQASSDDQGANAGGTTGLIVFLVVALVIAGGGTYLYLQNRKGGADAPQ